MKPSVKKFSVVIPPKEEGSKKVEKKKKKEESTEEHLEKLAEHGNKNDLIQAISSALETKGISHEAGKHQDVISISEGYKKKIYISRPATKPHRHCYFCRLPFETYPIGNPIKIEKGKYVVEGVFCSFNCLLAYQQDCNGVRYRECGIHIHTLYRELYQTRLDLPLSTSWKLLQDYGGELTPDQWRQMTQPFVSLDATHAEAYRPRVIESSEIFIGD